MTKSNTAVAAIAMLGVGIYAPQTLAHNNCQSQARSAKVQSSTPPPLVINQPGVVLEQTGFGTSADTTSEILILSGVNQTTSNTAQVAYTSGSDPTVYFDFESGQTQMTVPIAIKSFKNNRLNVTNNTLPFPGGPIKVSLNGATCNDGLYVGLLNTISLSSGDIGYNCNTAGTSRTLSLTAQDGTFKTLFIYGSSLKDVGEPFILGLNCKTDGSDGTACTDVGQDYDMATDNNYFSMDLDLLSDITVINLTASETTAPVDVYMYSLNALREQARSVNCTCTCPR